MCPTDQLTLVLAISSRHAFWGWAARHQPSSPKDTALLTFLTGFSSTYQQ